MEQKGNIFTTIIWKNYEETTGKCKMEEMWNRKKNLGKKLILFVY